MDEIQSRESVAITEARKLKEKLLLREIAEISPEEIAKIFHSPQFQESIFSASKFLESSPHGESGFRVIRSMSDGSYYYSQIETSASENVDLDKAQFADFPEEERGRIQINSVGEKPEPLNPEDDSTWKALDILSLHFHPQQASDGQPSWFDASFFDFKSLYSSSSKNSLKLRVLSGFDATALRTVTEDETQPEPMRQIQKHYGYFMFGMFAKNKRESAEQGTFEANHRSYETICMRLSENKIQMLVLYDDPEVAPNKTKVQQPAIFEEPAQDLENRPDDCREISEYYSKIGFNATIIFFERNPDTGEIEVRNTK